MPFLILLWVISAASILIYLVAWPAAKPWPVRLTFDAAVLILLVLLCIGVRPGTGSNPMESAVLAFWRPFLSAIYVPAISILFLSGAGTVRHFIFRIRGSQQ